MWKGNLPRQPEHHPATAVLTFEKATGERGTRVVVAKTDTEMDRRIVTEIGTLRSRAYRMVKTEITDERGDEWLFEYDGTGHIMNIFCNGEVTP